MRAYNAACGGAVAALHCCRMSGVCFACVPKPMLPPGAAEGALRLTQGMEQVMDVQMADVQCDQQPPNERVAYLAALQVVPTTHPHHASRAGGRNGTADAD